MVEWKKSVDVLSASLDFVTCQWLRFECMQSSKIPMLELVGWFSEYTCLLYNPDDLSSIPGTHFKAEENWYHKTVLCSLLMCYGMHEPTQIYMHMRTHVCTHTHKHTTLSFLLVRTLLPRWWYSKWGVLLGKVAMPRGLY